MSIYTRGEPTANQLFRENTDKTAGSMANVTRIPSLKRCVCCKRMRTAVTGRETQAGFLCGMCGMNYCDQSRKSDAQKLLEANHG